jgi:glycine/serine hydroxymethyltransferase
VTSGIRIGTPYVTSRGMMAEQMKVIGGLMAEVLHDPENETVAEKNKSSGTGAVRCISPVSPGRWRRTIKEL